MIIKKTLIGHLKLMMGIENDSRKTLYGECKELIVGLTALHSIDSEESYNTIKEHVNKISPVIREYGKHHFITREGKLGGALHFVFDRDNGKLQEIRLQRMNIKKYKLHKIKLWKRHWWT